LEVISLLGLVSAARPGLCLGHSPPGLGQNRPAALRFALTTKYQKFVEKLDAFRAETRKKLLQASKSLKRKQEDL